MKRIPVQIQLFIILFSVLLIPVSIITYYTSVSIVKYSESEIADSTVSRTKSNSELANLVLEDVILDILKLVKENKFNSIRNINSYQELTSNFDSVTNAIKIMDELQEMQLNESIVYSVMYYVDNADYVLSTNKGIVPLMDYEDMSWLADATEKITGAGSTWYPRFLNSSTVREQQIDSDETTSFPVISFVYPLNRLTTSARGTIVVNVLEERLHNYLSVGDNNDSTQDFVIDMKGNIISHDNKELLFTSIKDISYIEDIKNNPNGIGYDYIQLNGERILYTYHKEFFNKWTYVTTYSMDSLSEQATALRDRYLIVTIAIFILGTIFTVILSKKIAQPVKKLVSNLQTEFNYHIEKNTNELSFLETAFHRIRQEENELYDLLSKKSSDTKNLMIHKLLSGDNITIDEDDALKDIFPYHHYLVALIAVDNSRSYIIENDVETRNYQRNQIIELLEKEFSSEYKLVAVRYETDKIAAIINIELFDQGKVRRTLSNKFTGFKQSASSIIDKTLTIAISGVHTDYYSVVDCVFEATEALEQKLIKGKNSIIYYESEVKEAKKLAYSFSTEKKIMNYLVLGDITNIEKEIHNMIFAIKEVEDITNDNVMLIFNQLVGAIMKYLVENNLNTHKVFRGNMNLYQMISSFDTIDEIKDYLIDVFRSILEYNIPKDNYEPNHFDKVMKYLSEHYNEELILEDVAAQIGISYSYLRKLVKEETGKSVIDNINLMRIDEVKRLLLNTDKNMSEIAELVGYRNVQSVNRFFKKYEGISPSEYKALNRK